MEYASCTHKGKVRSNNEDCIHVPAGPDGLQVAIVADGMGGHNAGEVASSLAVRSVLQSLSGMRTEHVAESDVRRCLEKANETVLRASRGNAGYDGMGTTLTLAVLKAGAILVGHVGDSRAYLCGANGFTCITRDHSYVQELVDSGLITKDEALVHPRRNIITRALGLSPNLETDVFRAAWREGDIVLLCTDGLTQHVMEDDIETVLKDAAMTLPQKAEALLYKALEKGGSDNVSLIAARCA